jgi:hypothetical protein
MMLILLFRLLHNFPELLKTSNYILFVLFLASSAFPKTEISKDVTEE